MKLLLDTHVVLWWLDDPNKIAEGTRDEIAQADTVLVSAVVAWEIAIKRSLGKLTAPHNLEAAVAAAGFEPLPISLSHALAVESLPPVHRDPFDRLLIAQANFENCTLVTRDEVFQQYPVQTLEA